MDKWHLRHDVWLWMNFFLKDGNEEYVVLGKRETKKQFWMIEE